MFFKPGDEVQVKARAGQPAQPGRVVSARELWLDLKGVELAPRIAETCTPEALDDAGKLRARLHIYIVLFPNGHAWPVAESELETASRIILATPGARA